MQRDDQVSEGTGMKKLCSTCAYREHCKKKFSATVANGQVRCMEYAPDMILAKKNQEPDKSE